MNSPGPVTMEFLFRAIRHLWPNAIFENAATGEMFQNIRHVAFNHFREALAYKSSTHRELWSEKGLDESLHDTMIHLIRADNGMTLVVDSEPSCGLQSILNSFSRFCRTY